MGQATTTGDADELWVRGGALLGCAGVRRNHRRGEALRRHSLALSPDGERAWLFALDLRDGAFGRRQPGEAVAWLRFALRHGESAAWASLAITIRDGGRRTEYSSASARSPTRSARER